MFTAVPMCLGSQSLQSEYLLQLHAEVTGARSVCPRDEDTTFSSINGPAYGRNMFVLIGGGLSDPPLLVSLLHAIKLTGPFSCLDRRFSVLDKGLAIECVSSRSVDFYGKSFQSAAAGISLTDHKLQDFALELHKKIKVTLRPVAPLDIPTQWGDVFLAACRNFPACSNAAGLKQSWCTVFKCSSAHVYS